MTTPTAGPWLSWDRVFDASAPKRSNSENGVDWDQLVTAILASGATKPGYSVCGLPAWNDDEVEALWSESGGIHAAYDQDAIRRFVNIVWLMHGTPWAITASDDVALPGIAETRDLMEFVVVDHTHRDTIDAKLATEDFDDALTEFPNRFITYAQRSADRARMNLTRIPRYGRDVAIRARDVLRSAAFRDRDARQWAWTGGLGDFATDAEREVAWELANYVTAWLARRSNPDALITPEPNAPRSLATVIHEAILGEIAGRGQVPTVAMELTAERASAAAITLITAAA